MIVILKISNTTICHQPLIKKGLHFSNGNITNIAESVFIQIFTGGTDNTMSVQAQMNFLSTSYILWALGGIFQTIIVPVIEELVPIHKITFVIREVVDAAHGKLGAKSIRLMLYSTIKSILSFPPFLFTSALLKCTTVALQSCSGKLLTSVLAIANNAVIAVGKERKRLVLVWEHTGLLVRIVRQTIAVGRNTDAGAFADLTDPLVIVKILAQLLHKQIGERIFDADCPSDRLYKFRHGSHLEE